jgi:hypothetical protein
MFIDACTKHGGREAAQGTKHTLAAGRDKTELRRDADSFGERDEARSTAIETYRQDRRWSEYRATK